MSKFNLLFLEFHHQRISGQKLLLKNVGA